VRKLRNLVLSGQIYVGRVVAVFWGAGTPPNHAGSRHMVGLEGAPGWLMACMKLPSLRVYCPLIKVFPNANHPPSRPTRLLAKKTGVIEMGTNLTNGYANLMNMVATLFG